MKPGGDVEAIQPGGYAGDNFALWQYAGSGRDDADGGVIDAHRLAVSSVCVIIVSTGRGWFCRRADKSPGGDDTGTIYRDELLVRFPSVYRVN